MSIDCLLHLYKNTYYALPQSIKTFLGAIYGSIPLNMRYGRKYGEHQKILDQYLDGSTQYQIDFLYAKTYETVAFAYENIPFYRRTFDEWGIHPRKLKTLADIKDFPVLNKDDIKRNIDDLYVKSVEPAAEYFTGGSTSTPTKYYLPLYTSRAKEKVYNNYLYTRVGYAYRDKAILLKGREVAKIAERIFWEYEPVDNYLVLSSNFLNSEFFDAMFTEVRRFAPCFVFGYPSAVLDFVSAARKRGVRSYKVQGVVLSSEMVYRPERELIRDFFEADILTHYGHTERAVIGSKMNSSAYEFMNSYGLCRISGNEIIGTSFDNFVMPFVNYATNDYVEGSVTALDGTDVALMVDDIEGRLQEYLVTRDGRLVSICVMGAGHYGSLSNVDTIQYQQWEPGYATLLVKSDVLVDRDAIKCELENFIKQGIEFEVVQVEDIPRSSRGKRVMCKQQLDIEKFRELGQLH